MQQKVLPAFLNKVLQALVDLMLEGIDYSCTKKALEDIQCENSHLFQFCQDVGLIYDPNSTLTANEIWKVLEPWYQDNGILIYQDDGKGKFKAIWNDQPRKSDLNVKSCNQVINRFKALFPKAKNLKVPRKGGGKSFSGLQGIGFASSSSPSGVTQSTTDVTQPSVNTEPKKALQDKDFNPINPISSNVTEKNQKLESQKRLQASILPDQQRIEADDDQRLGFAHTIQTPIDQQQIGDSSMLKGCDVPLEVGCRIRCYPTLQHSDNNWIVTAKVIEIESEKGYFNGCTVEYKDRIKGLKCDRIPGGNPDWILERV
ncbi:MAG: hypothetical protein RMY34_36530 [Aulosira sp. DedQUE10]|nr:hypothetical protein [Aulosira sp. DedQUE10]